MNTPLTIPEAQVLLEKYYEGQTSVAEDRMLQEFLQREDLPDTFQADRALLGYFTEERKKLSPVVSPTTVTAISNASDKNTSISGHRNHPRLFIGYPVLRWTAVAAVMVSGVLILNVLFGPQTRNYAYIDGVRYTDTEVLKAQAQASIDQLSAGPDEMEASTENMNELLEFLGY